MQQGQHVVDGPVVQCAHRDDLLREHVERVDRGVQLLDPARPHALDDDCGLDEVAAELREEHSARGGADLVPGPPDPLQGAGDRGRRLDLHDQVDGPHVDAEFEAARRDDSGQSAALQLVLDDRPGLLAHRPVMGSRDDRARPVAHARGEHLGRWCGRGHPVAGEDAARLVAARSQEVNRLPHVGIGRTGLGRRKPLLPQLVQTGGEPLREAAGVDEHECGPVCGDEVQHAFFDVWPDRGTLRRIGRRRPRLLVQPAVRPGVQTRVRGIRNPGCTAEFPEIGHRHLHRQLPGLRRRRLHDTDGLPAGEEIGDRLDRPHGGGQPDALRGSREQLVEPRQAHREMRAAFRAGDGVDLVDDHRLHAAQRFPGGGGEEQEQRFGGGDEDVGRAPGEVATLLRGGVARAHPDPHVRHGQPQPSRRLTDADQRRAEVAFDVDGQRLQW